jgi:sugar diacid utilization regulator
MYRVILRDRAALADLVGTLLAPLSAARDGAGPLLDTLEAYFASGQVAMEAARRLHLSVRAVTYRLARVRDLTGQDPARPADALALQVAVIGARLLDWPATPLETESR